MDGLNELEPGVGVAMDEDLFHIAQPSGGSTARIDEDVLGSLELKVQLELKTKLVDRRRPRVQLTPAGRLLADYVLRAEALLANARRAVTAGDEAGIGVLAISASGIPGTYLVPMAVAMFHARHPDVEIDFQLSTSAGALELVREHRVEIGVVGGMTLPSELEAEPLLEDEVVLVGPPSLSRNRLRPRDLDSFTWVSREEGSATRAAVDVARWEIGLRSPRTLAMPSWEAVKLAVANGAGIAAISRFALDTELANGSLVELDVPRWRLRRTISAITARDVPLTAPARRFLELLRNAFQGQPNGPP